MENILLADSGNLLIILLGIAYAVYSMYRKYQKSRPAVREDLPEPLEEDREEGGTVRRWLDEVILGEEFVEPKPARAGDRDVFAGDNTYSGAYKSDASKPEDGAFLQDEMRLYGKGYDTASGEGERLIRPEEKAGIPEFWEEPALADFDLHKAVIYAAVLSRPYS